MMQKTTYLRPYAANPKTCIRCKRRPALGGRGAAGKCCAECNRKPDFKTKKR